MLVIPKQTIYRAIKIENNPMFYLNLGKYLDEKYYRLERTYERTRAILILKDNELELNYGDYILVDINDKDNWIYLEKENFEKYIIVEEN